MKIEISPEKFSKWLLAIIVLLLLSHTGTLYLFSMFEHRFTRELFYLFSVDKEGNFPAYFSSAILGISAFLFWVIGKSSKEVGDSQWKWWMGLAGIFLFLSLDEAVQIHEKFDNNSLLYFLNTSGLFAWPWVILYLGLVAIFIFTYFRFWLSLPLKFRVLFAACSILYVIATIGFEMLGALEYESNNGSTKFYVLLYTIEEGLEMLSISFLIYALLRYIFDTFSCAQFVAHATKKNNLQ